jgi:hypothetical protein
MMDKMVVVVSETYHMLFRSLAAGTAVKVVLTNERHRRGVQARWWAVVESYAEPGKSLRMTSTHWFRTHPAAEEDFMSTVRGISVEYRLVAASYPGAQSLDAERLVQRQFALGAEIAREITARIAQDESEAWKEYVARDEVARLAQAGRLFAGLPLTSEGAGLLLDVARLVGWGSTFTAEGHGLRSMLVQRAARAQEEVAS